MDIKESDLEEVVRAVQPVLTIPWWGKVLIFIIKLLPLPPWIKLVLPIIIGIIEAIPDRAERRAAKREVTEAVKSGDLGAIEQVAKKHWKRRCEGVGCPTDIVRE